MNIEKYFNKLGIAIFEEKLYEYCQYSLNEIFEHKFRESCKLYKHIKENLHTTTLDYTYEKIERETYYKLEKWFYSNLDFYISMVKGKSESNLLVKLSKHLLSDFKDHFNLKNLVHDYIFDDYHDRLKGLQIRGVLDDHGDYIYEEK